MASTRRQGGPKNVASKLLTPQENDVVFGLLGQKCVSVATAVTQLYFGDGGSWSKKYCGATCFVKDNDKRSYFIRVYDVANERQLWEQELYNQFKYDTPQSFFHMFATDHCWAGLNFANEIEANGFKQVINDKIQRRHQRRQDKRRQAPTAPGGPPPVPSSAPQAPVHALPPPPAIVTTPAPASPLSTFSPSPPMTSLQTNYQTQHTSSRPVKASSSSKDGDSKKKDKSGRRKFTKADISLPQDFKHVSHVGWDPEKGFNLPQSVDEMDPQVKGWFNTIGVSDDQLKDQNTAQFIRNFIDKHGGMDALKEDAERIVVPPPPPTTRGGPPPPPPPYRGSGNTHAPPPPPSRSAGPPLPNRPPAPPPPSGSSRGPPPPAPYSSRGLPPAPVTSRGLPPPLPPSGADRCNSALPAPPPSRPTGFAPPPPPPPAVAPNGMVPPAPPLASNGMVPPPPPPPPAAMPMDGGGGGGGGGGRGGLLSQIHEGISLKKVDPHEQPRPAPTGRGALLDQINKGGFNLKRVTPTEREESPVATPSGGLGAALFSALQTRAQAIQSGDGEDSDSDEFDDEEWDED